MEKTNKLLFAFFVILVFSFPLNVLAETIGTIIGVDVRVRSTPDTTIDTNKVDVLSVGNTVTLVDTTKYESTGGTDCPEGWYKLNYNGSPAYVCSRYVSLSNGVPGYNTSGWIARIADSSTYAWYGPAYSSGSIERIMINSNVTILDSYSSYDSCTSLWYKVKYSSNNKIGYVCGTYLTFKENIILEDTTYEATLQALGFPESYWPYLSYLHSLYPNWGFIPSQTNLNWNDAIRGEAWKNYIQSTDDNYRASDVPQEGSTWFYAKDAVTAFFMDPRNFLQEKYIFMFEKLNYEDTFISTYPNAVRSIFGTSYLAADEYVNYFLTAGSTYRVSPVHLAARTIQEGCGDPNYDSISGTSDLTYNGNSLVGYYNYFNIGAHTDSYTNSPVARGLAYAKGLTGTNGLNGLPWDTREKAIMGGASFLSSGYISSGQHTPYYQKFNTSPTSLASKYTHQYMTNVQAPSSEATTTFNSYKKINVLNNVFYFEIPVYLGMPEYTSLPTGGSGNNFLSKITINNNDIVNFDKDVIEYNYFVPKTTTSININSVAENSSSIISGNGEVQITSDKFNITINVTAENGNIKTYKIGIIRVEDINTVNEILSKISYKSSSDYIYGISKGNTTYSIINNFLSNSPSSIITIKTSGGTKISSNYQLSTGQMLTIQTTANETKTFDIVVTGDVNGDGDITILDLLKVQKHILKASALSDSYLKAGDTNFDNDVTILDLLRVQKSILGELNL